MAHIRQYGTYTTGTVSNLDHQSVERDKNQFLALALNEKSIKMCKVFPLRLEAVRVEGGELRRLDTPSGVMTLQVQPSNPNPHRYS